MKKNYVHVLAREIDFDLEIDVELLNVRIFTSDDLWNDKKIMPDVTAESGMKFLHIITQSQLEEYESILDGLAYSRPKLLIIFGVLSFFTQKIFTPFEVIQKYSYCGGFSRKIDEKFILNKFDIIKDFRHLKNYLYKKERNNQYIYTLLDRWRKAFYMEAESENNNLYDDEITLSYFHILELLTEEYYPAQEKEITSKIIEFSNSILKNDFLFEGANLTEKKNNSSKLIKSILLPKCSVCSKIFYMLNKQGIGNSRLKNFITNFVKDRNSVAHGRLVYEDRVIYPVPPFFPIIKNTFYPISFYRILTAKVLSNYIGLTLYDAEWDEYSYFLMPTFEELQQFISEKKYLKISNQEFCDGYINNITPSSITFYLINKKINSNDALDVLTEYINKYSGNEEETITSIWSIIIIIDIINDNELKQKCIRIIKTAAKNGWYPGPLSMKHELHTLEYLGFEPRTLKKLLLNREVR